MGLTTLLFENPLAFLFIAIPLLYSIILHEIAHGWVAWRLGDDTAKKLGRLNLNPLKHLDPVGTVMLFVFGFGWAKPVPVNFSRLRNRRRDMILVSGAGVTANMLVAFVAIFLDRLTGPSTSGFSGGLSSAMLFYLAQINIILAAFNLIPLPPLDGSKILMGFAPEKVQIFLSRLEPYGFFIIIGLLYFGVLTPVIGFFKWILSSMIGLLVP